MGLYTAFGERSGIMVVAVLVGLCVIVAIITCQRRPHPSGDFDTHRLACDVVSACKQVEEVRTTDFGHARRLSRTAYRESAKLDIGYQPVKALAAAEYAACWDGAVGGYDFEAHIRECERLLTSEVSP